MTFAAVTVASGYALARRRDFGAGLLAVRPGPARAAGWIESPLTLAFRLQRGALWAWVAILVVWGYGNGAIVEPIVDGLQDVSTDVTAIFGAEGGAVLIEGYLATMGVYNATMVAIFVVLGVLSVRSEEYESRTEAVLATASSRWEWLGSHLIVLALGSVMLLAVTGVAMGLGASIAMGQTDILWDVIFSHLAFAPALLVILAVAGLLYGRFPAATGIAWILVIYGFFLGFFATTLDLPHWVLNLSPMEHVPGMPLEDFAATPLVGLTAVAVTVAAAALFSFRNRDLTAT